MSLEAIATIEKSGKSNSRAVGAVVLSLLVFVLPVSYYIFSKTNQQPPLPNTQLQLPATQISIAATPTLVAATATPTTTPTPTPNNNNFSLDYDYKQVPQTKGTVRIPILTYHHIAKLPSKGSMKPYYVTPEMLDKQLAYLKAKNYRVVTSQQFYDLVKKGKNPTQKTVMLTFDDGNLDNYQNAYPILKKYGFPGVFYISSNRLAISGKQLREMANNGMVIDSHGSNHKDLKKENSQSVLNTEIVNSKSIIQGMTKKTVVSFSYPGCVFDEQSVKTVASAGYKFAVSCGKSIDHRPGAMFGMSRMHVYNDLENFKKRLSGIWEIP